MKRLNSTLELLGNNACGYDERILRNSLCPMGRVNKPMGNKKTLPTAIVHTHRLLAHISTRFNSYYFLTATKPGSFPNTGAFYQAHNTLTLNR